MRTSKDYIKQKQEEMFLIIKANTVIDPWAMMVHPCNTITTYRAVMTKWHFNCIAFITFSIQNRLHVNNLVGT